ncbi:MAG: ABC transporter ATP-binding protein [Candidatus Omnitrophota bacterium]
MIVPTGLKRTLLYARLIVLRRFLRIMGVRPVYIILPVILSMIVAGFEGVSVGLLVPLAKGVAGNNFDFVRDIPVIKHLFRLFPSVVHDMTEGLSRNRTMFLFLVIAIFLMVVIKNMVAYLNATLSARWHTRFKKNIYSYIFNRCISFGKLFFDQTSQGYVHLVLRYSENVIDLVRAFEKLVDNFFILIVYFVIMLFISWRLTIVTICLFPILYLSLRLMIRKLEQIATSQNTVQVELSRKVFNILSCIPLVKAYSKEDETKEMYAAINEDLRRFEYKRQRVIALVGPVQELIITGALLIMIAVVALLLAKDHQAAEISIFVVFFYAARRALPMFNIFNDMKIVIAQAKPPVKEILKVLDSEEKFTIPDGHRTFEGLKSGIVFNHLNFSYPDTVGVLRDISVAVKQGAMTAIVGPTGSGKTTLISLLMRFYDCPAGAILLDETDIRAFTLKSIRAHIALVSQDALVINDTLRNNIIFGLDRNVGEDELMEVVKKAQLYDFITRLPHRLDTEVGDRGVKLSGGERQRVAIARSLIKGSSIFILDEATSSLDSSTEHLIQKAIDEAVAGRTAIVIAHRLSTIRKADKVVVIDQGRVAEEGTIDELLARQGAFYRYWNEQKFY